MRNYAVSLKRTSLLLMALALTASLLVVNFAAFFSTADAAQLSARSLTLSSTLDGTHTFAGSGTESDGAEATHTVAFTPSANTIGSALFKYCTTAVGTCTKPTNLNMAATTLGSPTGFAGSYSAYKTSLGSLDVECTGLNGLDNCFAIRAASATAETATAKTVPIQLVHNPDVGTFFVRVTTYATNTNTTLVDDGTVASAITEAIIITARVAETLGFSTTGNLALYTAGNGGGIGDPGSSCSALTGSGALWLGDPTEHTLSLTQTYENYSAFRIYTNAGSGATVWYEGPTLTRTGGPTIDAIAYNANDTADDSAVGSEQFGLGVAVSARDDSDTGSGFAVNSRHASDKYDFRYVSPSTDLTGAAGHIVPETAYLEGSGTIADAGTGEFAFVADTATQLAHSTGYITCDTAAVRYVANIAPTTEAGTYTTTLVYSAVPTY